MPPTSPNRRPVVRRSSGRSSYRSTCATACSWSRTSCRMPSWALTTACRSSGKTNGWTSGRAWARRSAGSARAAVDTARSAPTIAASVTASCATSAARWSSSRVDDRPVEVEQVNPTLRVHEDVMGGEPLVGDALLVQLRQGPPQLVEQLVGQQAGRQTIERDPVERLEDEQPVARIGRSLREHAGDRHAVLAGEQSGERLVLDLARRRPSGPLVVEPADAEPLPGPDEQVGVALVATEQLHEAATTVVGVGLERPAVGGLDGERLDLGRREAAAGHARQHVGAAGAVAGAPARRGPATRPPRRARDRRAR